MNDRISGRQLRALCFCGVCVPVFRLCCRTGWVWAALGSAGAAILLTISDRTGRLCLTDRAAERTVGRLLMSVLYLALLALAGAAGAESAGAFPETKGNLIAAWLILALAAWAAFRGPAVLGRSAGILLPVSLLLYFIVLGFSAPQIRPERLRPSGSPAEAGAVLLAMLIPAAGLLFRPEREGSERKGSLWYLLAAILATAVSAVTNGILSPAAAMQEDSFDILARSVSIMGVMQRFEALVSAAMLMSGFCLCGLFLGAAAETGNRLFGCRGQRIFLCSLPIPALFAQPDPAKSALWSGTIAISCGLLIWVQQFVGKTRKNKKVSEN